MDSCNLFAWANRELAQDAFLCWLLSHIEAAPQTPEGRIAAKLAMALAGDADLLNAGTVRVYKQYKSVDVILSVNDDGPREARRVLMIEDKVGANLYNDLKAYREALCGETAFDVSPAQVRCAVLKTEEDGQIACQVARMEPSERPRVMLRKEFLAILTSEETTSEILNDFIAHLRQMDEAYDVWRREPYRVWGHPSEDAWMGWRGLFSALLACDEPSGFNEWFYVNNPTMPFDCLLMKGSVPLVVASKGGDVDALLYFHIDSARQELHLKLGELDDATCSVQRDLVLWAIQQLQNDGKLPEILSGMEKPQRLGTGCYITLKRVFALGEHGWLILDAEGKVDLCSTARRLRAFTEVIPLLAEQIRHTLQA